MPKFVTEDIDPTTGPASLQRNAFYKNVVPSDLNPLDLVARQILTYKFTHLHNPQDSVRQAMRDVETVACAIAGKGTLLVAHNSSFGAHGGNNSAVEAATVKALKDLRTRGFTNITDCFVLSPIRRQRKTFHAEMQLLKACAENNRPIQGGVIGVSKPCCGKCAKYLKALGIDFSLYSKSPVGDWISPEIDQVKTTSNPAI
ncbi:nucleic acid/nucleotide deaminase domain-containing protein [Microbulbifer sp. JMSA004]|uniref:nucleic acid/nucleotide deaminase domain-containing protein n=1 Tax=Microbulbifer sp. JMSA004 TaxID=3243370 RepID=UPI0040398650